MTLKSRSLLLSSFALMVLIASFIIFQGYRSANNRLVSVVTLLDEVRDSAHNIATQLQYDVPDIVYIKERINSIPVISRQLQKILSTANKPVRLIDLEISFVRIGRVVDKSFAGETLEKPLLEQINNETSRIEEAIDALREMSWREIKTMQTRAEIMITAFFLMLVAYIVGVLFFLFRMIIQPVLMFSSQIEEVREGRREGITSSLRDDEIGALAREFNQMIDKRRLAEEELKQEITEHKQTVKNLRYSQTTLETVFKNSIPMCITNKDYEIIHANEAYYYIFGEKPGGKTKCYESRPGVFCHTEECPMRQILQGKKIVSVDSTKSDQDGNDQHYIITARPFMGANGELDGIVESFQDITERKIAEQEKEAMKARLIQSQKMEAIGTLAGGIAHDFNNILGGILGYTELALYSTPPESPADDYLEEIREGIKRAKDLVAQILLYSRQTEQEMKPVLVQHIIKEAMKLIRASTPSSIEIHQHIEPDCGAVWGDFTQIHQMLMNLCTNAAHAMDEKGVLEISLQEREFNEEEISHLFDLKPGRYIELTISDTGRGMDNATAEKIFDPFFTTKEVGEGTGLGLSVVYGVVQSHRGMITVESEPGKGTTFHVCFPRTYSEILSVPEDSLSIPRGDERILFVDDEKIIVKSGQKILGRLGYQVTYFMSSVDALEKFRATPDEFDLVITDQTMPKMTGIELTKELLNIRPDIPIILCTGYSKKVSMESIKGLGIRGVVTKPIDMIKYAKTIRMVLGEKKQSQV